MANTKRGVCQRRLDDKTIQVLVTNYRVHRLYKKRYIQSKKYLVHDPQSQASLQDQVLIRQSRPYSRRKSWIVEKILKTGKISSASKKELQSLEPAIQPEKSVQEESVSKNKEVKKKDATKTDKEKK